MSVFGYLSFVTVGGSDTTICWATQGGQRLKTRYGWKKARADGMVSGSAEWSIPSSITVCVHDTHTPTYPHKHTHSALISWGTYWGHNAQQTRVHSSQCQSKFTAAYRGSDTWNMRACRKVRLFIGTQCIFYILEMSVNASYHSLEWVFSPKK